MFPLADIAPTRWHKWSSSRRNEKEISQLKEGMKTSEQKIQQRNNAIENTAEALKTLTETLRRGKALTDVAGEAFPVSAIARR